MKQWGSAATAMKQWSSEATILKEDRGAMATPRRGVRAIGWRPLSTMGDAAQESGGPRLQFTIFFYVVHRSEVGSDSNEAVEHGAWSDGSGAMEE